MNYIASIITLEAPQTSLGGEAGGWGRTPVGLGSEEKEAGNLGRGQDDEESTRALAKP